MLKLEELEVYQLSESLADLIWGICISWDWFTKDTVGKQLVKAADSVGANIAEGTDDIVSKKIFSSVILHVVHLWKRDIFFVEQRNEVYFRKNKNPY
jgi:hypothetical protein